MLASNVFCQDPLAFTLHFCSYFSKSGIALICAALKPIMNKNFRCTCWPVFYWLGGINFFKNSLVNGFDKKHFQAYLQA